MFQHNLMLLLAALVYFFAPCVAVDFYVRPTQPTDQTCPEPCHTLDQYAQNISLFEGHTNISLLFLNGEHILTRNLEIAELAEIQITGLNGPKSANDQAVIELQSNVKIHVSNVVDFRLYSIVLKGTVTSTVTHTVYIINHYNNYTTTFGQLFSLTNVQSITQGQVEIVGIDELVYNDEIPLQSTIITDCSYRDSTLNFSQLTINDTRIHIQNTTIETFRLADNRNGISYYRPYLQVQNKTTAFSFNIQDTTIIGCLVGLNIFCNHHFTDSKLTITNTNFTKNIYGILTIGLQMLAIQDSKFTENLFYGLASTSFGTIHEMVVNNSDFTGSQYGLTASKTMILNITNTTIANNHDGFLYDNLGYLNIQKSNISCNKQYGIYGLNFPGVNGSNSNFIIEESNISHNGHFGVYINRLVQNITIQDSDISNNKDCGVCVFNFTGTVHNLVIKDNSITYNRIGISAVNVTVVELQIQNTHISDNDYGIMFVNITFNASQAMDQSMIIQNCTITMNNVTAIGLISTQNVMIEDSSFYDNRGTALLAHQSDYTLTGETHFVNNKGNRGGALSLINSILTLGKHSNITFRNNIAREFGGAIYIVPIEKVPSELAITAEDIAEVNDLFPQTCFFKIEPGVATQVHFSNNNAKLGGNDIYGASSYASNCAISQGYFNFTESVPTTSSITSDPTRVCFCPDDNFPSQLCRTRTLIVNETRFPGEKFTISLVLVGYKYGTVRGTVYANILGGDYSEILDQDQHIQTADLGQCNSLKYTVFSKEAVIIVLTAEEITAEDRSDSDIERNQKIINSDSCTTPNDSCTALLTTPIYVNVTLENCPLGFTLTNQTCVCDNSLRSYGSGNNVSCEIRDHVGYINRMGTLWVGVDSEDSDNGYLMNIYCPNNFCNKNVTPIELTSPDTQCNDNRTGVLCGRCKANYSLPLGSNRCIPCENNSGVALFILFTFAGFVIVFWIKILDLTVANGTINGLIFYANVVWGYNSILFPSPNNKDALYWLLTVPIASINLDFGHEICFFIGHDAFWKTFLQFVIPMYIWTIAGLIIFISHYSTRATKLFGNNSLAVLATLFLLSYGKILRTTINIFTFADLQNANNTIVRKVWAFDGTLEYGNSIHGILFLIAVLVLLLAWLPYVFMILLVPVLKAKSNLKLLRWINKLKPFFDVCYGPYKDKVQNQCWMGILLLVRWALLVIFSITSTISPNSNLLVLVVIAVVLLIYNAIVGLLYKKWYLGLIENLYILNLAILGGGYLFSPENDPLKYPIITAVSVSFAFFLFSCVLVIHLVTRFVPKRCLEKRVKQKETREDIQPQQIEIDYVNVSYDASRLRESLLESTIGQ